MRGTSDRCCVRCCKSKPVILYLFYHNIWELMPDCPNQVLLKQNNSKRTKLVCRVWKVVMFHAQSVLRLHQKTCRVYNLRRLNRRNMWKTGTMVLCDCKTLTHFSASSVFPSKMQSKRAWCNYVMVCKKARSFEEFYHCFWSKHRILHADATSASVFKIK